MEALLGTSLAAITLPSCAAATPPPLPTPIMSPHRLDRRVDWWRSTRLIVSRLAWHPGFAQAAPNFGEEREASPSAPASLQQRLSVCMRVSRSGVGPRRRRHWPGSIAYAAASSYKLLGMRSAQSRRSDASDGWAPSAQGPCRRRHLPPLPPSCAAACLPLPFNGICTLT